MGEEQKGTWQELLARNRAEFEAGTDLTVAVEEEFALLDPETLELTNRFEPLKAAADRTDFAEHVVGELIASEVEIRTGRCDGFQEAAVKMQERRSQIHGLARDQQLALGATGTHPWSRWQDQRIIDTPHYRRNDELLRYVVWRNNTFGLHVHVGIARRRPRDRACTTGCATSCPSSSRSRRARRSSRPSTPAFTRRGREIFTRMFPRCGIPDAYGSWQRVRGLRRVPLPHGLDRPSTRSSGGACARTSRIRRSRSASRRAARPRRGAVARRVLLTRSPLAARARTTRASRCPSLPHRLLEENMWRAIRYGLSGELLDFERGEPVPARARLEQLLEWVAPVADEIGAAPYLAIPERNAAERQIARAEEGASLEEIYAEQVRGGAGSRSVA